VSFTHGLPFATAGSTYFAPKSPLNPVYPPGSSGSWSGSALALFAQTLCGDCEQWTAMPTKSVCASWESLFASVA